MSDYSELKRLAEAMEGWDRLTECWPCDENGPDWQVGQVDEDDNRYPVMTIDTEQYDAETHAPTLARFYAAANPIAVLALIAENERLERLALDSVNAEHAANMDLESICSERDQLRAEIAGLKTGYEAYERVNAELKAETEGLRKDADKWQIVESAMTQLQSDEHGAAIWSACSRILISVASELNSVRSVVTEEGVTNGGVEIGDWRVTVERITSAMGKGAQS